MKTSKRPANIAVNASKQHIYILGLLAELFPGYDVRQEYCVSLVNPEFKSNREKFDLVILRLNVCIEIHGLQHFKPCCFGGITLDEAKKNLVKRQEADRLKEEAAREAGWAYIIIKYNEKNLTKENLLDRIKIALNEAKPLKEFKKEPVKIKTKGFSKEKRTYKWPKRKLNYDKTRKL